MDEKSGEYESELKAIEQTGLATGIYKHTGMIVESHIAPVGIMKKWIQTIFMSTHYFIVSYTGKRRSSWSQVRSNVVLT